MHKIKRPLAVEISHVWTFILTRRVTQLHENYQIIRTFFKARGTLTPNKQVNALLNNRIYTYYKK